MTRPITLLVAALLLGACSASKLPVDDLPTGVLHIETGSGEALIEVSIADTPAAREQGLMGVEEMAEDVGMVFLEEQPVQQSFWMKDTLIPLSVAFWDTSGEILQILDMEPCEEDPCEIYDPGVTWIGAVEMNEGFFYRHGIGVGDTATLER